MSETTAPEPGTPTGAPATPSTSSVQPTRATAWVGGIVFAAMMMVMIGSFHVVEGLVALFKDEFYLVGPEGLVVNVDYTTWGWVHLIAGIVVALAGGGLLTGRLWARAVGVYVAMVSALFNVAFLAAYPVWSVMMIVVDILVIWAITVHGREMKGFR